ncbi:MAG: hypothetical protein ISR65_02975 [Bacteriovoracaceae bacterium]|nr:hypothetical protein [Bacteriovoracaceae bacterium]
MTIKSFSKSYNMPCNLVIIIWIINYRLLPAAVLPLLQSTLSQLSLQAILVCVAIVLLYVSFWILFETLFFFKLELAVLNEELRFSVQGKLKKNVNAKKIVEIVIDKDNTVEFILSFAQKLRSSTLKLHRVSNNDLISIKNFANENEVKITKRTIGRSLLNLIFSPLAFGFLFMFVVFTTQKHTFSTSLYVEMLIIVGSLLLSHVLAIRIINIDILEFIKKIKQQ